MRDSVISCMQGHAFCTVCIVASMYTRSTCPTCRAPTLSPPIPNQVVRALVGDLEVKCPFNSVPVMTIIKMREKNMLHLLSQVNACDWIGNVHSLENHLHSCGFQLVACPIKGCHELMLKNKLEHHLEVQCMHRTVYCDLCGMEVLKIEYDAHKGSCGIWSLRRSASQNRPSNHAVSSEPRDIGEWYIAQQQMVAFNSETSSAHRSPNSSDFWSNPPPLRESFRASPSPTRATQPPSLEALNTSSTVGRESMSPTQFSTGRAHVASQSPARINRIDSTTPLHSELHTRSPSRQDSYISAASSSSEQDHPLSRDITAVSATTTTITSADRYQDDAHQNEAHVESSRDGVSAAAAVNRATGSPARVAIALSSSPAKRTSFAASPEPSRNATVPQKSLNKGFSSQYVKKASVAASPEPSRNATVPQKSLNKGFKSHYGGFRTTASSATSQPPVAAEEVQSKPTVMNQTTHQLKHSPSWWGGSPSPAAVQVNSRSDSSGRDSPLVHIGETDGSNAKQSRSLLGRIMNASPILGFSASKNDGSSSGVPAVAVVTVGNKASPSKRIKSEYSMWIPTMFNASSPGTERESGAPPTRAPNHHQTTDPSLISLPGPSSADLPTDDSSEAVSHPTQYSVANAVASPSTPAVSSAKRSKSEYALSAAPRPPSTTSKPKVETMKADLKSTAASTINGGDGPLTSQRSSGENAPEPKAPVSILKSSSTAPVSILKSSSKYSTKKKVPQRSTEQQDTGGGPIQGSNASKVATSASTAQLHPKPSSNSTPDAAKDPSELHETVKDPSELPPASSKPPPTPHISGRSKATAMLEGTKQMKIAKIPITSSAPQDAKAASPSSPSSPPQSSSSS